MTLEHALGDGRLSAADAADGPALARIVLALAQGAARLSVEIGRPPLCGRLGAASGSVNADGDGQRRLDLEADDLFRAALTGAGVGPFLSEEGEEPEVIDPAGTLAGAIFPLDGSSNIDVNAPVGTIFSILPAPEKGRLDAGLAFKRTGRSQLAAGFFIYGPQTSLLVTFGRGTHLFTLDRVSGAFVLVEADLTIRENAPEYAINASNYRHWHPPAQSFIDDCVLGVDGPRGRNFNMRWIASPVADSYRIFTRGGIFLYPADTRQGYGQGRLRLLYEANPVAFLAERAGGAATDGVDPVLDRAPGSPHQRVPLVMGSREKVERIRRYHLHKSTPTRDDPLFGRRGLMRA
jgi:fructose-1,6-bisphosphatase I